MILCIETSGEICSIALKYANNLICEQYDQVNAHSAVLFPMIENLFIKNNLHASQLNAVALSCGPGSYTGLRIGSAAAKSICLAMQIPLISISTLDLHAQVMQHTSPKFELYIPMIDARRMEVYMSVYNQNLDKVVNEVPHILSDETPSFWRNQKALIGGSGAAKAFELLQNQCTDLEYLENVKPNACHMIPMAEEKFQQSQFVDIANFEPVYLKPFYTTAKLNHA
jgi:tRNA threonylcarbamoyladenosine biosynthesis protein TsaB